MNADVARTIGWENRQDRPSTDTWTAPELWHRPDCRASCHPDHCVRCCGGYTVDDILKWLGGRGLSLMSAWWDDLDGFNLELDRGGHFEWQSPDGTLTLLAALEHAVLAVAP